MRRLRLRSLGPGLRGSAWSRPPWGPRNQGILPPRLRFSQVSPPSSLRNGYTLVLTSQKPKHLLQGGGVLISRAYGTPPLKASGVFSSTSRSLRLLTRPAPRGAHCSGPGPPNPWLFPVPGTFFPKEHEGWLLAPSRSLLRTTSSEKPCLTAPSAMGRWLWVPLSFPSPYSLRLWLGIPGCSPGPSVPEAAGLGPPPWPLPYPSVCHIVGAEPTFSWFTAVFPAPRTAPGAQ